MHEENGLQVLTLELPLHYFIIFIVSIKIDIHHTLVFPVPLSGSLPLLVHNLEAISIKLVTCCKECVFVVHCKGVQMNACSNPECCILQALFIVDANMKPT